MNFGILVFYFISIYTKKVEIESADKLKFYNKNNIVITIICCIIIFLKKKLYNYKINITDIYMIFNHFFVKKIFKIFDCFIQFV